MFVAFGKRCPTPKVQSTRRAVPAFGVGHLFPGRAPYRSGDGHGPGGQATGYGSREVRGTGYGRYSDLTNSCSTSETQAVPGDEFQPLSIRR
ncbi:hypothetical protein Q31a_56890 [Aureliella helgolandensis]|uniref:Uncharacterized protein n=1 Tax=Aureliella helgolandensis TaxID=2527968 RepID=A0A518GFB8_9BACT|nr:hypothetical protein Q31a_56890 [Aureliella helgolandensis]